MSATIQASLNATVFPQNGAAKVEDFSAKYASDVDIQLMARVKAGDDEAFNLLMQRNEKTVFNLAYRFTGSREVSADLAQDVFLRIYRAAGRYEPKAKFFTFLYTVTLNVCRNHAAKSKRRPTSSLDAGRDAQDGSELPAHELVDPTGSAEDQVSRLELSDVVRRAVESLPLEQREAVMLQRFQGLSYEEIAESLNLSVSAVKSKIHRAKLNLRERLTPYLVRGEAVL